MSDFKELVPEFYDVSSEGDFLDNLMGIQFGYRSDGSKVNNVQLPPWATGIIFITASSDTKLLFITELAIPFCIQYPKRLLII